MIFFGILFIIIGIALIFLKSRVSEFKKVPRLITSSLPVIGFAMVLFSLTYFYARPGHKYYIASPFGTEHVVSTPGIKFVIPFSRIQEWEKWADIKTIPLDAEGNLTQSDEGIEGVIRGGIPIRFIDQVTADVYVSCRIQMPEDDNSFIQLVKEFRHPQNLINNTLIPTIREQVTNTGYMFAAQNYISGSAADFRMTIDDQLKNGGFSVEKQEIFDTVFTNIQVEGDRQIKEVKTKYKVNKRLKNGVPERVEHDITKNNVDVVQVIVDDVVLEPAFKKRLEKQRDIASQKRVEMEAIELAKITQQKIVAEGERDKAQEKVKQELAQVNTLIAIETDKKKEVTKKELAEIALETAKLESKRRKVLADAKQYELQKADGLSEEAKYIIDKEVEAQIGVAKALAGADGLKLPQYYLSGSEGSSAQGDLMNLFLMKMIKGEK